MATADPNYNPNRTATAAGARTVTNASYAMSASDSAVWVKGLTGPITITLPPIATCAEDQDFAIFDVDGSCSGVNIITIQRGDGTSSMRGTSSRAMSSANAGVFIRPSPANQRWVWTSIGTVS